MPTLYYGRMMKVLEFKLIRCEECEVVHVDEPMLNGELYLSGEAVTIWRPSSRLVFPSGKCGDVIRKRA